MCLPPSVQASMGTGSPCCPKFTKGAPIGGVNFKGCSPIFPGITPSAPIHVVQEDSVASPSARVPDWSQGGAPHLATNLFPGVPPYFPLLIIVLDP